MSHNIPKDKIVMQHYAQQIIDAINNLGNQSVLSQEKHDYLVDRLANAKSEEKSNSKHTNAAQAATLKSNLAHGTHAGQSIKKKGSLRNAISIVYNFLLEEFEGEAMLLRDYGFKIQHSNGDEDSSEDDDPNSDPGSPPISPNFGGGTNPDDPESGEDATGEEPDA